MTERNQYLSDTVLAHDTHAEFAAETLTFLSRRTLSMTCTTPLDVKTSDRMICAQLEPLLDTYTPEELVLKAKGSPEAEV
jgi:hypothetical protein